MATNSVLITKRLGNDGWTITGRVTAGSNVPKDIFVYENTGTSTLGPFHSIVMVSDLARLIAWTGVAVPTNRNKFVRYSELKILVPREEDVDKVIADVIDSIKLFTSDFNSVKESTKTYVIN